MALQRLLYGALACGIFFCSSSKARAQSADCAAQQFGGVYAINLPDGSYMTMDSNLISPYWDFEAHYDSCRVLYVVSNFRVTIRLDSL